MWKVVDLFCQSASVCAVFYTVFKTYEIAHELQKLRRVCVTLDEDCPVTKQNDSVSHEKDLDEDCPVIKQNDSVSHERDPDEDCPVTIQNEVCNENQKVLHVSWKKIDMANIIGKNNDDGGVYVLLCQGGRIYIGKSKDVNRRIAKHFSGEGSTFTRHYPPIQRLQRLGNVANVRDAGERDETLLWMRLIGFQKVRGWKYTTLNLTPEDEVEIQSQWNEMFDLCRFCGSDTHIGGNGCHYKNAVKDDYAWV